MLCINRELSQGKFTHTSYQVQYMSKYNICLTKLSLLSVIGYNVMFFICTLYDSTFIGTFGVQTFKVTTDYLFISSYLNKTRINFDT